MNYPNGKGRFTKKRKSGTAFQKKKPKSNLANRGKRLEQLAEAACRYYYLRNHAAIDKIPTPMKIVYINGQRTPVFDKKSTVDFVGTIAGGRSIAFDCKSTELETRYPLMDKVEEHQWLYLLTVYELGGLAFLLIEFTAHNQIFYLSIDEALKWRRIAEEGGRKSIPYEAFKHEIKPGKSGNPLDFLKAATAEGGHSYDPEKKANQRAEGTPETKKGRRI